MSSCGHIDWPCCGCGEDLEHHDDGDICQGCGEPDAYCVCDEYGDDGNGDDGTDGDHETALRDTGWGVDEDYLPGGCEDFGCE